MRGSGLQARNERLRKRNPCCVKCLALGIYVPVDVWDHITPLWEGGHDVDANLQGLCHDCHDVKTAEEATRRGNPSPH